MFWRQEWRFKFVFIPCHRRTGLAWQSAGCVPSYGFQTGVKAEQGQGESRLPFRRLAHWVEQGTHNSSVAGSSPASSTNNRSVKPVYENDRRKKRQVLPRLKFYCRSQFRLMARVVRKAAEDSHATGGYRLWSEGMECGIVSPFCVVIGGSDVKDCVCFRGSCLHPRLKRCSVVFLLGTLAFLSRSTKSGFSASREDA